MAVFLTFFLHGFAHWLVGKYLGEEITINFNPAHTIDQAYGQEGNQLPIILAGPVFTLLQAIYFFYVMKRGRDTILYPFLLAPVMMRVLAGIMNFVNPNDEGLVSLSVGLGLFTLPVLTCIFLLYLVFKTSVSYQMEIKFNLQIIALVLVISLFLILLNQYSVR
ncbi:hypothetical protein CWM47_37245 [Spirosoma pollinicola]|uniref:Peptidase M50 domain-containing protein n=2 Tax=Spirosoma pollinicola TaxID=2057025 RepID=A0A2K8ZAV9_9BACT|nr:hypothetical protein CWM47_37245 [Spirosoma pollinicola]